MDVLTVDNISKHFGKREILNNISLSIKEGEIIGFVGPNGAGKTTTMKIITGLLKPNSGSVSVCGYNLKNRREEALKNLSAIVENPSLYSFLTGKENINFVANIRNIKPERIQNAIEFVGIGDKINYKVRKYSLGMKQRLALGISLMSNPSLLLLDEPTNGLDPTGVINLRSMLLNLKNKNKMSVMVSSHNLSEIEKICDRFIFIKDGKIIFEKSNNISADIKEYRMNVSDADKVKNIIGELDYVYEYNNIGDLFSLKISSANLSKLLTQFSKNEIEYTSFEQVATTIEQNYEEIYDIGDK